MSDDAPADARPKFGLVPVEVLASMPGLAFLQRIADGTLPGPPMAELIGFTLREAENGRVLFASTPEPRHYNPLGAVHGGYAATLLDSCMGCAVHSTLPQGVGYTTLELKLNLIRAITADTGEVRAEGKVLSAGRRVATAEGRLTDAAGRLLAHATTTCLIFDLPAPSAAAPRG